mgnify:FL=1
MITYFRKIGGFDVRERIGRGLRRVVRGLALYLDDMLLLAGGVCFVKAALDMGGRPAGLAVAGACLTAYAIVVAKSRGGGSR